MPSIANTEEEVAKPGVLHIKAIPEELRRAFNSRAAAQGLTVRDAVIQAMRDWATSREDATRTS